MLRHKSTDSVIPSTLSVLDIPNLGQAMALGALYNARTGHCTNASVLSDTLPLTLIESRDENAINTKFVSEDSYKEKFKAFGIDGNLKLNILANNVPLNAQFKYLATEKQSSKSVKVSLSYAVQTKLERINIRSNKIREYINLKALNDTDATHVVTGIQWGANMLCSFEHSLEEGETEKEVTSILGAAFNTLKVGANIGGDLKKNSRMTAKDMSVSISILGDIVPKADLYPTSVEDAVQFMRRLPEFIEGVNQGKGSVLQYKLEPIEKVRAHFDLETKIESVINNVHLDLVDKVESTLDTIVENRIRLTEALNDILEYSQYIAETEVKRIMKGLKDFNRDEREFKNSLSETVRVIQAGEAFVNELFQLLEDFEVGNCSSAVVDEVIERYQTLTSRISFIRRCEKINIQVISRVNEISSVLPTSPTDKTFVLTVPKSTDYTMIEQSQVWHIFRLLREDHSDVQTIFTVYDASISSKNPRLNDLTELKIVKYQGSLEFDAFQASILRPSIKLSSPESVDQAEKTKLAGHALRMPCPSSHEGGCHSGPTKWVCFKCGEVMQYEYNEFVYCECGKTRIKDCTFRCDSIEHGYRYKELHSRSIQSIFEKIYPGDDEINILLLGETGVGKSTFINAFANYLRYDSLEIAEKMEMTTLIQSKFEIEGTTVIAGSPDPDQNEKLEDGQSSTQCCRSYVFPLNDDIKIRLIDTPGIGDTRGVKHDRKNFEEIMNYISRFKKISGICILLLPDTPRLTTSFRFCIDELLLHLHKSAADNILFTFTKTRSSFYGPGDTMTPLTTYMKELEQANGVTIQLEKNRLFFFDNEAFRLYAALKQGLLDFDPKIRETFAASWTQSVVEAQRLVKRVRDLKPHNTDETVTLDRARRLIILLAPPMTQINENITIEVNKINNLKVEAQNSEISAEELKTRLMYANRDLNPVYLKRPRMVCTSSSCSTVDGDIVRYNQHCHVNCRVNAVTNSVGKGILKWCSIMKNWKTCRVCGCGWEEHMHLKIDYTEVKKQKTDTERELNKKLSTFEAMNLAITEADERIKTLESEKQIIFDSLMTFTNFLLRNSILIQNSGIVDYIDMSIRNQDKIAQRTKDFSIVESLQIQRDEFVGQTEIIERAIEDGESHAAMITESDVNSARDRLCRLKVNGEALAKVMNWGQQEQNQATVKDIRIGGGYVTGGWGQSGPISFAKRLVHKIARKEGSIA